MTNASLRRRLDALDGGDQPPVTLEECLERLRSDAPDDPEFERRLRSSPIGHLLAAMAESWDDEEPGRPA